MDEVAGADPAALAATLLGLSSAELLGSDMQAAQAVVAATQQVINALSAVQLLGIEAWSRRAGEEIAADRAQWDAVNPGRAYPGPRDEHEFMDADLAPLLHVARPAARWPPPPPTRSPAGSSGPAPTGTSWSAPASTPG